MSTVEFLLRKLERRDALSAEERQVLRDAVGSEDVVASGKDMIEPGDRPKHSTLLLEGFAGRYRLLREGSRQITAIHIAGDFVDLHSFVLKTMDHGITALSQCRIAYVPHERILEITKEHPHLTRLLWLSTVIDGAIHREWITAMGRRSALGRLAHLICELYVRLKEIGLAEEATFKLPLTQTELGDVLGISQVHVNRSVKELRQTGFVEFGQRSIRIIDYSALADLAEFDPAYLNVVNEPR